VSWATAERKEGTNLKSRYYLAGHRSVKRIQLLWAVKFYCSDTVDVMEEDVVGLVARLFLGEGFGDLGRHL